jgi:hydrogenase maturation protease
VRACIVGLGERAAGDDAVGPRVIDALRRREIPDSVELCEARDASELVALYAEVERLVLVDAVVDGALPGAVSVIDVERLDSASASAVSSHGMSVGQALALGSALYAEARTDVRVVAVSIARPHEYRAALSPEVEAAVASAAAAALAQLA